MMKVKDPRESKTNGLI